eukprot:scaffold189430_cov18-Tisochrysis_lutea.AAC.1
MSSTGYDSPLSPKQDGHSRPHGKAGAKDRSSNAKQPAAGAAAATSNPGLSAEQLHPSWAAKMLQKQKASLAAPSAAAKVSGCGCARMLPGAAPNRHPLFAINAVSVFDAGLPPVIVVLLLASYIQDRLKTSTQKPGLHVAVFKLGTLSKPGCLQYHVHHHCDRRHHHFHHYQHDSCHVGCNLRSPSTMAHRTP